MVRGASEQLVMFVQGLVEGPRGIVVRTEELVASV